MEDKKEEEQQDKNKHTRPREHACGQNETCKKFSDSKNTLATLCLLNEHQNRVFPSLFFELNRPVICKSYTMENQSMKIVLTSTKKGKKGYIWNWNEWGNIFRKWPKWHQPSSSFLWLQLTIESEKRLKRYTSMGWNPTWSSNLNQMFKAHILWEGHKNLQNLHLTFDYNTYWQK